MNCVKLKNTCLKSGIHPSLPIVFNGKKRLFHISVEIFFDL